MKIIKISAIWCGACLITNKVWNELKSNYQFDFVEYDYDMDEEEVMKLFDAIHRKGKDWSEKYLIVIWRLLFWKLVCK